ncbi:MAG: 2,3-bisphosphoglycerate-independent phosphoglycerate mutase [bacterium]|nr:2,3-bisphosphoglycerate-independent phosphoglycerate mutase [bacterium]
MNQEIIKKLSLKNDAKIIMVVIDGLGGIPGKDGKTELETAQTPNIDQLAKKSICGLSYPLSISITPGSGPAHLALFGYDPFKYEIGRGLLEALGVDFSLESGDLAARGNFATINEEGSITDRRAGRISTENNAKICKLLQGITIKEIKVIVSPIKEHRFLIVFRGTGLIDKISESDPQKVGLPALEVRSLDPKADYTAEIVNRFVEIAKERLKEAYPANMVLLRGFASNIKLPTMQEIYKLNPCAIATYPMYKGIARLVGMEAIESGETLEDQIKVLRENYQNYDFFYLHIKKTDSYGEDGNFDKKVAVIEEFDSLLPKILNIEPEVIVVTGDHSTPSMLLGHSWHSVPTLIYSKYVRCDQVNKFSENSCISGGLGKFKALEIMPLALANALKLAKFGA